MDWNQSLDQYCERVGPALLAEPVNLVSNLAFIVAGAFALRLLQRHREHADAGLAFIVALVFAIGIGSGLFHSFATRWAVLADVLPILVLIYFYFGYFLRVLLRWPWPRVALGYAVFVAVNYATGRIPSEWVNGSEGYFGALIAMAVLGLLARRSNPPLCARMLVAAGVFTVSLVFRSVDMAVCAGLPLGTHFLWHLFNGLLLYLITRAAILARARAGA